MSKIYGTPKIDVEICLKLTNHEAQALYALTRYGTDVFLACFYKHLGVSILRPHEEGLRSLFETIYTELPPILSRMAKAKEAFRMPAAKVMSREKLDGLLEWARKDAVEKYIAAQPKTHPATNPPGNPELL